MGSSSSIIAIVGLSGSGKTTLVEKLIRWFSLRGFRVGAIKHSRHAHQLDTPGKDSFRHKLAGAERSIFIGPDALQFVADLKGKTTPEELAGKYLEEMDVVFVEGFIEAKANKIEVVRRARGGDPILSPKDGLIALATDLKREELPDSFSAVPVFTLDDIEGIAGFIQKRSGLTEKIGAAR